MDNGPKAERIMLPIVRTGERIAGCRRRAKSRERRAASLLPVQPLCRTYLDAVQPGGGKGRW